MDTVPTPPSSPIIQSHNQTQNPIVPPSPQPQTIQPLRNGLKEGLIAFVINALLTIFLVNLLGVLASGIYLGLIKGKGKYTYLSFFVLSIILGIVSASKTIYSDPTETIFVGYIMSPLLIALIPLGIAFIVRKIVPKK